MTVTVLLVVLWLAAGGVRAEAVIVPDSEDCGSVAVAYIATKVTGNPNYTAVSWSCQDVPKTEEKAA
jgi:hypothetical protein